MSGYNPPENLLDGFFQFKFWTAIMTNAPIKRRIEQFVKREGRRPRILVSNMGPDNHDHDTKLLAASFAESGFDVDISPLRQTPCGTARMAIENDVHVICFLSSDTKHKRLITDMARELKAEHAENVRIVLGGAIPRSDYKFLYGAGVALILRSLPADDGEINQLLDLFE
jgi:methylmalonyl-CoA mutase